jgi:hypothetical protein
VGVYLVTGISIGVVNAKKYKKPALVFCMPITFFLMHLAYAAGYIVGKYKVMTGATFHATINR